MKRMTKLLLGAAFVFGVLGGAFCIASFCLGFGGSDFAQVIQSGGSYAALDSSSVDFSQLGADDIDFEQSYYGIDELDLNVSGMECRMIPWDKEEWKVAGCQLPADFKCREADGTLKIKSGGGWRFLSWGRQQETACLEIRFPQYAVLDVLEIDSGIGDILMDGGMLVCEGADIDCGVGNCTLCMDVRDELRIDCGVGDVSLLLAGSETDFDYKLDCGVGDITVEKGVRMLTGRAGTEGNTESTGSAETEGGAAYGEDHPAEAGGHGTDHQDHGAGTAHDEEHALTETAYGAQDQTNGMEQETEHAVSGAKQEVDHGADRKARISCGVGSVTLAFTEQ